jgi:hypothetical protein
MVACGPSRFLTRFFSQSRFLSRFSNPRFRTAGRIRVFLKLLSRQAWASGQRDPSRFCLFPAAVAAMQRFGDYLPLIWVAPQKAILYGDLMGADLA